MEKYDRFGEVGFNAGIFLKGSWKKQNDIYSKLQSEIVPAGKKTIVPKQTHGSNIVILGDSFGNDGIAADGVLCGNGDYCLTIKTADCIPVMLAERETGFFGAIHVGWRGLAGGIIENLYLSIKNLDMNFNRLYISLGPSIGSCCFELGGEVAVLFDDGFVTADNDRYFLDARGLIKEKLLSSGASKNKILDMAECTSCNAKKYYSFRRDGHAQIQMVSYIYKS
ncbi:MAG: polyphenol oxidase family protein [Candidatus Zixiibacteriota bacterium]|nr:MAG: polyphenol oxidase family protein [candidate division Zixibacteria bacterium]